MDELDLLKKDWKRQSSHNTLSAKEIYPMLLKKSSSIVKTLFYISVAELAFWIIINTIVPVSFSEEFNQKMDNFLNDSFFNFLTYLSYVVIAVFIYLLYRSYRSISIMDSVRGLIKSIINTRKVIKYYVAYNLIVAGTSLLGGFYYAFTHDPELTDKFAHFSTKQLIVTSMIVVLFTIGFIVILWLFYKLIYGLLLKRLNNNYKELKKLEV
ncbi:hypothetical protein [Aestuariibaculum sediminum]|uniref:Uncharacterized protein n=1 Tax=Aestuariibaculum sediminum TaxID=2770637 RepID=A0A8J6Q8B5_9FLAO|nr:hypothetical protein [Aestuariibaculum sediminum]MBD0833133.1 hypothetical protein [Aestuariibaculum sediminum]